MENHPFDFDEWSERILEVSKLGTPENYQQLLAALEEVRGNHDPRILSVLLRSFQVEDDYGVYQAIIHAVEDFPAVVYCKGLIEELSAMLENADGKWAEVLFWGLLKSQPDVETMAQIATEMPPEKRAVLVEFLHRESFGDNPKFLTCELLSPLTQQED